jgi:hypothetical protein
LRALLPVIERVALVRPWNEWVRARNSWRPVNALARRIAVSIPSAPELPKKVFRRAPGETSASFSASSATTGTW